jgi:IS30 family transposase
MLYPSVPRRARGDRYRLLEQGQSLRSIALSLGRSPSSLSREIKRNTPPLNTVKYRGNRAQKRAENRSRRNHAKKRLANPLVKAYVEYHLIHDGWTPQSIAGRLSLDFPGLATNYESIYLWIYTERRDLIPTWPGAIKSGINGLPARNPGFPRYPTALTHNRAPVPCGSEGAGRALES